MPVRLKALPFDERNDRDFEDLTNRIRNGLDLIRKTKSLKPTQDTLAKLAKCSRRTLSLRRWPVEELKKIKHPPFVDRQSQTVAGAIKKGKGETPLTQLINQIRNYQDQNGQLFDRVQYLEEEQVTSALIRKSLEEDLEELRNQINQLEKQLRTTKLTVVRR